MKNLLIVEGETEKKFFLDFKENLKTPHRLYVFNLAQNKLNIEIVGKKYDLVSIILDGDLLIDCNLKLIAKNIDKLNSKKINIYLQNKNFEDELVHAIYKCKKRKDLYNLFYCKDNSADEFKKRFLKVSNLKNMKLKIDFYGFYVRNQDLKLSEIKRIKIKSGKDLFAKQYL